MRVVYESFECSFLLAAVQECFSISFVLHAIFSSNKRLQEIFFFKITQPPLKS